MTFHTQAPRTVLRNTGVTVDADLPKLCDACADRFTRELCDTCFEARAAHARRKGMPEYMIRQLRPRIYVRPRGKKGPEITYPLTKESATEVILQHLESKRADKELAEMKKEAARSRAAARRA